MNLGTRRGISLERAAIWVALASVSVFIVWTAIRVHDITVPMYGNADIASAPMLAELFGDRGSGSVVLGYYPWLESLLAMTWTSWLPDHVQVWKAAPFVLYGLTVALVGWTVKRAFSATTGLVVALAMAAPAPMVINMLGAPNQRLPLLLHAVLIAAFLVTAPALADWGRAKRWAWALGLVATLAPGVASDPLVVVGVALPFIGAVALGWWLRLLRRGIAVLAAVACVAGVVGGWLLEKLAEHERIVYVEGVFELASSDRVLSNLGLLLEDVALFAQGHFASAAVGSGFDGFTVVRELIAIAAIVAVVVFAFVLVRSARTIVADGSRTPEQRLLGIYWALSIVAVSIGFIIIIAPFGLNSVRYLVTLWPALLTLVVIVYGRRAVTGLALLAAGAALIGSVGLSRGVYTPAISTPPDDRETSLIEQFAADNDLDHGYTSYWNASPITVQSDFAVRAYPIEACGPTPDGVCPFSLHVIEAWYEPKDDVRSFYLLGHPSLDLGLGPPPAAWGAPFETAQFGDFTIYAYDYDIASRLQRLEPGEGPPPRPLDAVAR